MLNQLILKKFKNKKYFSSKNDIISITYQEFNQAISEAGREYEQVIIDRFNQSAVIEHLTPSQILEIVDLIKGKNE